MSSIRALIIAAAAALSTLGGPVLAQGAGIGSNLPDAPAKPLLLQKCVECHDLSVITSRHMSGDDWRAQVQTMAANGAEVTPAEGDQIADYLATYYGLTPPPKR